MLTRNQQDHSLFGLPPEVPGRAPDQSRGGQAQRHFLWSVLLLTDARGAADMRESLPAAAAVRTAPNWRICAPVRLFLCHGLAGW